MIESTRLLLQPATLKYLRAELAGYDKLAAAMEVEVPTCWPPDLYGNEVIRYLLEIAGDQELDSSWGMYYVVRRKNSEGANTLIGVCGFKGPPSDQGEVEVGYGIARDFQRQGYATEATRALTEYAFRDSRVECVFGQTLVDLVPSIGVMKKLGFRNAGAGDDPHAPPGEEVVRYEITRDQWFRG